MTASLDQYNQILPPGLNGQPNPAGKLNPLGVPSTPTPTATPSDASANLGLLPDLGLSAYQTAAQQLATTPSPTLEQAQYQPPKLGEKIITGLLGLLFPGSHIASLAGGYAQGQQHKADTDYARTQAADEAQYAAAEQARQDKEKALTQAGQMYEAQVRAREAADYHQGLLDEAHERATALAQDRAARLAVAQEHVRIASDQLVLNGKKFGLSRDNFNRLAARDKATLSLALTKDVISEDQFNRRMAQNAQTASLLEQGRNARYAGNHEIAAAGLQARRLNEEIQGAIRTELASMTDTDPQKQTKIQGFLDNYDAQFEKIMTPIAAKHPELGAIQDEFSGLVSSDEEAASAEPSPTAVYEGVARSGAFGGTGTDNVPPKAAPPSLVASLADLWVKAGGDPTVAHQMGLVAANESAGDPYRTNPTGPHAVGLWQINPAAHGQGNWTDPLTNAQMAVQLYKEQGMQPWEDSRNKGAFGGWGGAVSAPGGTGASPWLGSTVFDYTKLPPQRPGQQPLPADPQAKPPVVKPPPNPQQEFTRMLDSTVATVKADPTQFNAAEQGIDAAAKQGVITPQQRAQALAALQQAMRPHPGANPTAAQPTVPPADPPPPLSGWDQRAQRIGQATSNYAARQDQFKPPAQAAADFARTVLKKPYTRQNVLAAVRAVMQAYRLPPRDAQKAVFAAMGVPAEAAPAQQVPSQQYAPGSILPSGQVVVGQ
jgi:Lysozyme like domain